MTMAPNLTANGQESIVRWPKSKAFFLNLKFSKLRNKHHSQIRMEVVVLFLRHMWAVFNHPESSRNWPVLRMSLSLIDSLLQSKF